MIDITNITSSLCLLVIKIKLRSVLYRDGVCKTCDAVDDNIKGMYQLMAKWEELNKAMAPAYK
jgi:hypothetical protein